MLKKVFGWLATLLLAAVILACIGMFVAPRFGWNFNAVYGASMEPAIKLGSLAVMQPVDPETVKVGDIIKYAQPRDTSIRVTHRVIQVVQGNDHLLFRTQGDANEAPDPYAVPAANVVGRVWFSVPYAGYAMDYIKTPLGFGLLIGIPAALIVGIELRSIFLAVRELRRKGHVKQAAK